MEPTVVLIIMLIVAAIAAVVAVKRNRSGLGFFALGTLPVVPVILLVSQGTEGDHVITGWAAFACPVVALIAAICVPNGKEVAVSHGSHGDFVRCPLCAEAVRREAVKCRYCSADLVPAEPR